MDGLSAFLIDAAWTAIILIPDISMPNIFHGLNTSKRKRVKIVLRVQFKGVVWSNRYGKKLE